MTLHFSLGPNLCVFASLADIAKGGDGAKSALREILYSLVAVRPPCDSVVKIGLIYVSL
jgi:hypothetical protein